jgi:Ca-activated chloride channel family protein
MKLNRTLRLLRLNLAGITAILSIGVSNCVVSQETMPDRPGVPYFVTPDENTAEALPLKSTSASVQIAGVIAHITVKQVYRNSGKQAIEAVYVFPGSTRAAVHAMTMKIGERSIVAKIEEREKARNDYAQAVSDGRSASLLEQHRPNVFQMSVGNIMPGDLVEVELQYTENLVPTDGIYEFVYPTVVGPRYSGSSENRNRVPEWNANPYLNEGELPGYTFQLECDITSGIPLRNVRCPSHSVKVDYKDKKTAAIKLDGNELQGGNRDFILQYRLGGDEIESGLWLYSDGKENFFMATIQPPDAVKPESIPPREYIFIVDVSGSMFGFPLEVSKKLISDLLKGLKSTDRFNILFFAGGSNLFAEKSVSVTPENMNRAMKMLESQSGSGGTELLPALRKALAMETNGEFARSFVIATDGYVTVEKEAFALVKSSLNKASFFAFGIGSSVNRFLIEGIAHAGAGEAFVITGETEAKEVAEKFRKYISTPVLSRIELTFNGFDAFDVQPSSIPDVFSSRPVVVFGKYHGTPSGNISLSGTNGTGLFTQIIKVDGVMPASENQALKYLWAREQIRMADDYSNNYEGVSDNIKKQVTELGLKYNLLTAYTSFVSIDSEIRNLNGTSTTVRQPLPLPQGVSNYAVGTSSSGGSKTKATQLEINLDASVEEKEADGELEIFQVVESMPEFPGGDDALKEFLKLNLVVPEDALKNHISGKVIVQFTVNTDGSIHDIVIMRSLGYGCDEEVIRVIKAMPVWIPGKQRGKAVKTTMILPVNF